MNTCRTPDKNRYATREAAAARAPRAEFVLGKPLYPYDGCPCGWVHLTSSPNGWIPDRAAARPEDVARIRNLTADDFTDLVSDDTKTRADRADRLALRHPDNLTRWRWTLKALRADITQQIRRRTPDINTHNLEWLRRANGYRDTLTVRLAECQALRHQASTRPHREEHAA